MLNFPHMVSESKNVSHSKLISEKVVLPVASGQQSELFERTGAAGNSGLCPGLWWPSTDYKQGFVLLTLQSQRLFPLSGRLCSVLSHSPSPFLSLSLSLSLSPPLYLYLSPPLSLSLCTHSLGGRTRGTRSFGWKCGS